MRTVRPQFITDRTGKKISVVLPIKEYKNMMEELEELEDIRHYDEAKSVHEPSVPIEKAFKIIEANLELRLHYLQVERINDGDEGSLVRKNVFVAFSELGDYLKKAVVQIGEAEFVLKALKNIRTSVHH